MSDPLLLARGEKRAHFRILLGLVDRIQCNSRLKKISIILSVVILALTAKMSFEGFQRWHNSYARIKNHQETVAFENIDPLVKIRKSSKLSEKNFPEGFCVGEKNKNPKVALEEVDEMKEDRISELVLGHPIEEMLPYIFDQDPVVANYLVAIAKKESNWGKLSPRKNGRNCYNYWGYRGGENQTASGYSCFDSPDQAVEIVGARIEKLIDKKIDTPSEMVVWKCGSSCAGHDPGGVAKWIADVGLYIKKINS